MKEKIKVSILCLAYNHEKYIGKTLDSFINQDTNFQFEVIVHDDASTDNTTKIIKEYQKKYPRIIKPVFQEINQYPTHSGEMIQTFLLPRALGEYICLCEGDDYWIDTKKIQKQVDFMDKNKDFSICFTKVKTLKNGKLLNDAHSNVYPKLLGDRTVFSLEDILLENFIATCSVMYRKKDIVTPKIPTGLPFGDWTLNTLTAQNGKIKYINKAMAVYRVHQGGVWSSMSRYDREKTVLSFYSYINKYFKNKYSAIIIDKIKNMALYHISDSTKFKKVVLSLKKEQYKHRNLITELHEKTKYADQLLAQIDQIKNSLSWKLIMFIRLKVLDTLFPKRLRYIPKIKSTLKNIKDRLKTIRNIKIVVIPFEQKKWPSRKPLVSIVIPCYNYGKYINEAVDSVLKQTFQNFEIIIVESNSTDNSRSIIQKMTDKRIIKLYRNENHLAGDNRNYGINKANGKYICCLDPDDILKPTYLEKAIFILETQNYDLVSTSIETFGTESKIYYQIPNPTLSDMTQANHISTVAVFKKTFWKKSHGYHDWGLGAQHVPEDWDLWLRMSALGARFYNIHEPLMLYRIHGTNSLSNSIQNRTREEQRIEILNYNEHLLKKTNFIISRLNNKQITYNVINKWCNIKESNQHRTNILFALPYTVLGGADKIFTDLVKLLDRNNIKSIISTTVDFDNTLHDTTPTYQAITDRIYHLPRFLISDKTRLRFIEYLIKFYKIEVIFIGGSQFYYDNLPHIKKSFPNIKIIDIQFNTDIHFKNAVKSKKYIDRIIAENQTVYDAFVKVKKFDPATVDLISYGIDTNMLKPTSKKQLPPPPIPKNKFVISYIGRLSEEKNPGFMIKLAQKYKNNKKLFFVLAGPGNMFDELKREIESLNLKNIFMPGTISSAEYLSFTDVLVLPSKIDGNPIIIKEAFSMAVPVVASNVGGIPYLVKDDETGFICKIDDIKSFSSSIDKLVSSPTLLHKMKKNCRSYAVENLDIESVNKKFLKVFKEELTR